MIPNKKLNQKGFSLIEMLVTVGLLGILAGIATLSFDGTKKTVNVKVLNNKADIISKALAICKNLNDDLSECDTIEKLSVSCRGKIQCGKDTSGASSTKASDNTKVCFEVRHTDVSGVTACANSNSEGVTKVIKATEGGAQGSCEPDTGVCS